MPADFSQVASSPNYPDLKPYIPAPVVPTSPAVFYSSTPAEIVVFQGQPQWEAVTGTQLLYASNTASPVFKYLPTNTYYYLTSGRWFSSAERDGSVDIRHQQSAGGFPEHPALESDGRSAGVSTGNSRRPKTLC